MRRFPDPAELRSALRSKRVLDSEAYLLRVGAPRLPNGGSAEGLFELRERYLPPGNTAQGTNMRVETHSSRWTCFAVVVDDDGRAAWQELRNERAMVLRSLIHERQHSVECFRGS